MTLFLKKNLDKLAPEPLCFNCGFDNGGGGSGNGGESGDDDGGSEVCQGSSPGLANTRQINALPLTFRAPPCSVVLFFIFCMCV